MGTAAWTADRAELERVDEQIGELLAQVARHEDAIDRDFVEHWAATAQRLALQLDRNPPRALTPAALAEMRSWILQGVVKVQEQRDQGWAEPLDLLDDLMVRAEAIRHILRDALDADIGVDEDDAAAVAAQLQQWLDGVPQRELARLAGRSLRQWQRWASTGGVSSERLKLLARLVALLRHGWSPRGVAAWFDRPRRELDGKAPLELMDDPAFEEDLIELARQGRGQYGS